MSSLGEQFPFLFKRLAFIRLVVMPPCRDNCKLGLYCDGSQKVCMNMKELDATCDADKEYVVVLLLAFTSPVIAARGTLNMKRFV